MISRAREASVCDATAASSETTNTLFAVRGGAHELDIGIGRDNAADHLTYKAESSISKVLIRCPSLLDLLKMCYQVFVMASISWSDVKGFTM